MSDASGGDVSHHMAAEESLDIDGKSFSCVTYRGGWERYRLRGSSAAKKARKPYKRAGLLGEEKSLG